MGGATTDTYDRLDSDSEIFVEITDDKLSVDAASSFVTLPSCGGISIFIGKKCNHCSAIN